LLALVMFFNVSEVSAATTVDTDSVVNSSDIVKNHIESKKTVPTTLTVNNEQVTSEQYLYLLTSTVTNINNNNNNAVTVKTVAKAPNPSENLKSGNLYKSEYLNLAYSITKFINTNGRLPNFIDTSKGKMNPDNMIYTYSRIISFYKTNNRLPNFVSIAPWNKPSGEGLTTPVATTPSTPTPNESNVPSTGTTVDIDSVVKSSDTVKNYVESKKAVPSTITVAGKNLTIEQYLYLLTSSVTNINNNNKNTITIKSINKAPNPNENVWSGSLSKSEYIKLAYSINKFINTNGRLPNFISTSLGNMRPENMIYTYSKITAFYKTNNRLPNTVSVTPWNKSSGEGLYTPDASIQAKIDAIGYKEAIYGRAQGNSDPYRMEIIGWGDCWASSLWLYNKLSAAGVSVRTVRASSSSYPLHQWVQINTGNGWVNWNYIKYSSKHIGAIGSGYWVAKTYLA